MCRIYEGMYRMSFVQAPGKVGLSIALTRSVSIGREVDRIDRRDMVEDLRLWGGLIDVLARRRAAHP